MYALIAAMSVAAEPQSVVMVAETVPPNSTVLSEQVYLARMDAAHRPSGAVSSLEAVVGRRALATLHAGTAVRVERIAPDAANGAGIADLLRPGEQLVRLAPNPARTWLRPGDRVDVLSIDGDVACVLAEDGRVLPSPAEDLEPLQLAVSGANAGEIASRDPASIELVRRHPLDRAALPQTLVRCGGPPAPLVADRAERPHRRSARGATVVELLRGNNAFLGELRLPAGARVPAHRDPTEEYLVVLEGQGIVTIDGTAYPVASGSVVYMPARAKVSFVNGASPLTAFQVFAGPAPAVKYADWTLLPAKSP